MNGKSVLILPPGLVQNRSGWLRETPYGPVLVDLVEAELPVLIRTAESDPRALIYAAKEMGCHQVIGAEAVYPISPLLEPGDLVVPADLIDLTKHTPSTFFVGKGYGFVKVNPPFCPSLQARLLQAARRANPRSFRGAVYVGFEGPREPSDAEFLMFRQWGAQVAGIGSIPEAFLARELELCYASIAIVLGGESEGGLIPALMATAAENGAAIPCGCNETMKAAKEEGVVGEDWRTW